MQLAGPHRRRGVVVMLLAGVLSTASAAAQASRHEVHAEVLLGSAWNFGTPLVIRLPGADDVRQRPRYRTHPWSDAPYYAYRAGYGALATRGAPAGYEAELLHHKLYIDDPKPPIERFEVTHGYNLVTANAVRPSEGFTIRIGIGVVVAHAEGRITGERVGGTHRTILGGGYHVAGLTAQVAAARRYALASGRIVPYAIPEAKLTASLARVPLGDAGGSVFVPNLAAHLLAGLGVRRIDR